MIFDPTNLCTSEKHVYNMIHLHVLTGAEGNMGYVGPEDPNVA